MTPEERLHWAEWDHKRACDDGFAMIIGNPPDWYSGMYAVGADDIGSQFLAAFDNEEIAQKWADAALQVLDAARRDIV